MRCLILFQRRQSISIPTGKLLFSIQSKNYWKMRPINISEAPTLETEITIPRSWSCRKKEAERSTQQSLNLNVCVRQSQQGWILLTGAVFTFISLMLDMMLFVPNWIISQIHTSDSSIRVCQRGLDLDFGLHGCLHMLVMVCISSEI